MKSRAAHPGVLVVAVALGVVPAAGRSQVAGEHKPDAADREMAASGYQSMERDIAARAMRDYGACLVARAKAATARANMIGFLAASPSSPESGKWATMVADGSCLEKVGPRNLHIGQLRMPQPLLRGAILRSLYLRKMAKEWTPDIQAHAIATSWSEASTASDSGLRVMRKFGDCVVAKDQAGADAILRADVNGPATSAAFDRLRPALGYCLQEGSSLKFSKPVLESVLAEALYRQAEGISSVSAVEQR